ncbi:DUF4837 family protein [bacterium]|nr:DUF4837 family protein [bacterium]
MKVNIKGLLLVCALSVLAMTGCVKKSKLTALGPMDEVTVVCSDNDWKEFQPVLADVYEQIINVPRPEKLFAMNHVTYEEFVDFKRRRHVVFLGHLDSVTPTTQAIESLLMGEDLAKVKSAESFFFKKKDAWAYRQVLVVLTSNDAEFLKQRIIENKEMLFSVFNERVDYYAKSELYGHSEKKLLTAELMEKYGCQIRIPQDFSILQENAARQYVMLYRNLPKRWVLISWVDSDNPALVTRQWCIGHRNKTLGEFSGSEFVEERRTADEFVDFNGYRALKLTGLYGGGDENSWPRVYGGPFHSYTFFVPEDQRIYMVDYSMFAPDRDKKYYLRKMDLMVHTFSVKKPSSN